MQWINPGRQSQPPGAVHIRKRRRAEESATGIHRAEAAHALAATTMPAQEAMDVEAKKAAEHNQAAAEMEAAKAAKQQAEESATRIHRAEAAATTMAAHASAAATEMRDATQVSVARPNAQDLSEYERQPNPIDS
jgi:hypothetical protein